MRTPQSRTPPPGPGDERGVEDLLVSFQRRIYFFIRSMVYDPDDARDVLQDVNAIILRKKARFRPGSNFKAWSFAIARFECLTYLRQHDSDRSRFPEDMAEFLADGAEERADDIERWMTALGQCRELLPDDDRRLLQLRYEKGTPLERVAEQWGTTEGALKQKLFRTRKRLKQCILNRLGKNADTNFPITE